MNYIKKSKKVKNEYFPLEMKNKEIKEIYEFEDSIWIEVKFETILELTKNYLEIVDVIKAKIQNKLWQNKEKINLCWNTYIIFCVANQVGDIEKIKKEIEENKYCCKKYVIRNKRELFEIPYFMNFKCESKIETRVENEYEKILSSSKEAEYIKNIIEEKKECYENS